LEERRESERSTRREDPDTHAVYVDPQIPAASSNEADRGLNVGRDLGRREAICRSVIERDAGDTAPGEVLPIRPKDTPVLRGGNDLFRRVAVDEEHDRARASTE
jgi:hypothetical protein